MPGRESSWKGHTVLVLGGSHESDEFKTVTEQGFESDDEQDIRVEEAAMAVARAVFARGGRLAFHDDPVFTPLFIEIARDYWEPPPAEERGKQESQRFAEAPLVILSPQPRASGFEGIRFAVEAGYVEMLSDFRLEESAKLTIVIGGAGAVSENIDRLSRARNKAPRIVCFPSTGGAASAAERYGVRDAEAIAEKTQFETIRFEPPEGFLGTDVERGRDKARESFEPEPERLPDFRYAIYPLVIAVLLDEEDRG